MSDDSYSRFWPNLADPRLGAKIVEYSDQFFGAASRLIDPREPRFEPDLYDEHGKWMDGWETRRRRNGGHDHLILKLPRTARIHGITLDTRYFTGNYPPGAQLYAACSEAERPAAEAWRPMSSMLSLAGDAQHYLPFDEPVEASHLRLDIFPDGGVARLRVHGVFLAEPAAAETDEPVDLASLLAGSRVVGYNDSHYGTPNRMLAPGPSANMGDGWETRRRREPGNDWCIIELGRPGILSEALIDTRHFKGNYPAFCSLSGAYRPHWQGMASEEATRALITDSQFWPTLLAKSPLGPDAEHRFTQLTPDAQAPVTHVKLDIYPDGGISRLRLFGKAAPVP